MVKSVAWIGVGAGGALGGSSFGAGSGLGAAAASAVTGAVFTGSGNWACDFPAAIRTPTYEKAVSRPKARIAGIHSVATRFFQSMGSGGCSVARAFWAPADSPMVVQRIPRRSCFGYRRDA